MKTKRFLSMLVSIGILALSISACNFNNLPSNFSDSSLNSSQIENEIHHIYQLYLENGGDLSYEDWLKTIKGEKGEPGEKGEKGDDGHSPVVTIGQDGYWYIDGVNIGVKAQGEQGPAGQNGSDGAQGPQGETGPQGPAGQNGSDGAQGPQGETGPQGPAGQNGSDGAQGPQGETGPQGPAGADGQNGQDGVSILSVIKTASNGLVDTYTIYYSNGATSTFTVTNGAAGVQGIQGIEGQPGADGHTPEITIGNNGDWYVDGVDTGVAAQGQSGLSAYELFLKYHPDYSGSEWEWVNDVSSGNKCNLFGHQYFEIDYSWPTYDKDGGHTYRCAMCGHEYVEIMSRFGGKNDLFGYALRDEEAYIIEYFGDDTTVEIPSEIDGYPVTGVGFDDRGVRCYQKNYSPISVILPSSVETIEPGFFDENCVNVTEVTGLENIRYCRNGLGNIREAIFSQKLEVMGNFSWQRKLVIPDDVELYKHSFGGDRMNEEVILIDGLGEPTLMEEDGIIYSADGTTLIYYPWMRDAYSFKIPDRVTRIYGIECGVKLKELIIPNTVNIDEFGIGLYSGCEFVVEEGSPAYNYLIELQKIEPDLVTIVTDGQTISSMMNEAINEQCQGCASDYDKALALHDWLINTVEYDFTYQHYDVIYMMRHHVGVCAAYAETYHYLLMEAGINSEIVGNFDHAWVAAELDGNWVYIDPTWDDNGGDQLSTHTYFGFGTSARQNVYGDAYPDLVNGQILYLDGVNVNDSSLYYACQKSDLNLDVDGYYQTILSRLEGGERSFSFINLSPSLSAANVSSVARYTIADILSEKQYIVAGNELLVYCYYDANDNSYCIVALDNADTSNELFDTSIENGLVRIDRYKGNEKEVTVPTTINGIQVGYIGRAFYGNDTIEKVNLPEGLIGIKGNAFVSCHSLKTVNFPSTLQMIGDSAFSYCNNLSSDVILPEGFTYLGAWAFNECHKIQKVVIPSTVTTFRDGVFSNCNRINYVKLTEGLEIVPAACFSGCKSLKTIVLPESLVFIGVNAFGQTGITRIHIPANVMSIGTYAFDTTDLVNISVDYRNQYFKIENNALVSYDGTRLIRVISSQIGEVYYVSYGIKYMDPKAMEWSQDLTTVYIPTTVVSISYSCFARCYKVRDIYYDGTLEEWNQITLAWSWHFINGAVLHCLDGDCVLSY